jgi:hypothetical protein
VYPSAKCAQPSINTPERDQGRSYGRELVTAA